MRRSGEFDLGRDDTRIKDKRDAVRQEATVDRLLARFFHPSGKQRREIQVLADEVGMGKTFVALGVAYSMLRWMDERGASGDLAGCYQKVLVVTPPNAALFAKWKREVEEFVRRCVPPRHAEEARRWFAPAPVTRLDQLAAELRRPSRSRGVIVADMGLFAGRRFEDYDLKRRVLLGQLFRLWGNRLNYEARARLLKGAPRGWPVTADGFGDVSEEEAARLPLSPGDIYASLSRRWNADDPADPITKLLERCRDIAALYVRGRDELFADVERRMNAIYKEVCRDCIRQALPLVIVDEAHNWKNGPSGGTNNYDEFAAWIASRTRRMLLLTATPFQLAPAEMLELLKLSDQMAPSPDVTETRTRFEELKRLREDVVRPALKASTDASRRFQRAWARLPKSVSADALSETWAAPAIVRARERLRRIAEAHGASSAAEVDRVAAEAAATVEPDRRELVREALRLFCLNADLSQELGGFVIRHRRHSEHRLFRVGEEHGDGYDRGEVARRPDAHLLHHAPGLDVAGEAELPHYVLMRCVSEMKNGRGRSSLGTALTGCYSTLLHSYEGQRVIQQLGGTPAGRVYLDLLKGMVSERQDVRHPKVVEVVREVVDAWHAGEKSLIFCFRVNTARRLREIIHDRITRELSRRRQRCLGGEAQLKALRSRLTGRDRDLVTLGLDRVIWSFYWARDFADEASMLSPGDLRLTTGDLREVARLALTFGVDLTAERVDRVFLHRAAEFALATRLLRDHPHGPEWTQLLRAIANRDLSWVSHPYGLTGGDQEDAATAADEHAASDERGVHSVYDWRRDPRDSEVDALAAELEERQQRARRQGHALLDAYAEGPSLWLGRAPHELATHAGVAVSQGAPPAVGILMEMHKHLARLSTGPGGGFDWTSRRLVMKALRRAALRDSVLLRILPERADVAEDGWGVLLAAKFFDPLPRQRECMADRIAVFLEDLSAASGSFDDPGSTRYTQLEATRLRDQRFVALVDGSTKKEDKERILAGFNTPLLPEVLVCTSVGQEGIDLHRHCRHVVHYDLAWNPAVLEQRTGRADRIGSKTFRERSLSRADDPLTYLEIGVPFLAGTYDERMYEELRLRAQTFEVLTGGDFAVESADGHDGVETEGAGTPDGMGIVPLPIPLVEDLRVALHVWSEEGAPVGAARRSLSDGRAPARREHQ